MKIESRSITRRVVHSTTPPALRRFIGLTLRERWLVSLKRQMARLADSSVRNVSPRMRSLEGKYSGERCFIMGNGPSLNQMDLELLSREYVWGANKCYLLFDRVSWRPAFYVGIDTRVVPDIRADINRLAREMSETTFFFPAQFREQWVLRSGTNVYWYNQVEKDSANLPDGMFTRDASKHVSAVHTVTVAALQLAVHLGFDPIYLIGCDTSYSIPDTVRKEGSGENLVSTEDDDPNHFVPEYFGRASKWHDPHPDKMIFHYQQAREVCESLGVKVYNATLGGKLEVFQRVDYEKLF